RASRSTVPRLSYRCPLSLHDALPISKINFARTLTDWRLFPPRQDSSVAWSSATGIRMRRISRPILANLAGICELLWSAPIAGWRSEEHTSELQSRENLVCRLLLEKKK